jgi:hypothetical protein
MNLRVNIGVWISLTMLVLIGGLISLWPHYQFAKSFAVAQGQITQKLPNEHQSFYFIYTVNQKVYSGRGSFEIEYDKIKVGDAVKVFFNTNNPSEYSLGLPAAIPVKDVGGIVALSAILPLLGMVFLHRFKILPHWSLFEKTRLASKR